LATTTDNRLLIGELQLILNIVNSTRIDSRIRLFNLCFLAQKMGLIEGNFEFSSLGCGAFSWEIDVSLLILLNSGLIVERSREFRVKEKGKARAQKIIGLEKFEKADNQVVCAAVRILNIIEERIDQSPTVCLVETIKIILEGFPLIHRELVAPALNFLRDLGLIELEFKLKPQDAN